MNFRKSLTNLNVFRLGDCCLPVINSEWCEECICHEDGKRHPDDPEQTTQAGCHLPNIGDGYCDDSTNTAECNYDGGDCCNINSWYLYCKECICYPEAPQNPNDKKIGYLELNEEPVTCYTCSTSSSLVAWQFCYVLMLIGLINFSNQ